VAVCEEDGVGVTVGEEEEVLVELGVLVCVGDAVPVSVDDAVCVEGGVDVRVELSVLAELNVALCVWLGVAVLVDELVLVLVKVLEGEGVAELLGVSVTGGDVVALGVPV